MAGKPVMFRRTTQFGNFMRSKSRVGGSQERSSLTATCAVGYVIAQKSVTKLVETTDLLRRTVYSNDKRKRTVPHLNEAGLNKTCEPVTVHLMPLHCGFEAARMGKSSTRKT